MIPFALETLPLHYAGVPRNLREHALAGAAGSAFPESALELWHRSRLRHSCRLLGLNAPPRSLWSNLGALRSRFPANGIIYSLRYFANTEACRQKTNWGTEVHRSQNWVLLQRKNPYCFGESQDSNGLPLWASLRRVAIKRVAIKTPTNTECLWLAKCHWQVFLAQQLKALQQQPTYVGCEDVLRLLQSCPPLLLEGMKSNAFLLKYYGDQLCLYTPRSRMGAILLCGTTRNWLCLNAPLLPAVKVIQRDLTLSDMLWADGLLICNAAMGLRLVRELWLPGDSPALHCYDLPVRPPLRQLLAMYWNARF